MLREFTCIMCPQGCEIVVEAEKEAAGTAGTDSVLGKAKNISERNKSHNMQGGYRITGNRCPRGAEYVTQEMENPMRSIASSVLVEGGELPLASVRLTRPIPKERIFAVMEEIKKVKLSAPVEEGTVVISNVLGLGSDVMVTKAVERQE